MEHQEKLRLVNDEAMDPTKITQQWTKVGKAEKTSKAKDRTTQALRQGDGTCKKGQMEHKNEAHLPEGDKFKASPRNEKRGGRAAGADDGKGHVVFEQLRKYLLNKASPGYVQQITLRLVELARNRRMTSYLNRFSEAARREREDAEITSSGKDEVPLWQREKYEGLESEWNIGIPEHQERLAQLLQQWIIVDKETQQEVENRLRVFHFEQQPRGEEQSSSGHGRTYLEAVKPASKQKEELRDLNEKERLRLLCLQPAVMLTKLRTRTSDEVKAIVMIHNHEIEVPAVPPFLRQSMDPGELACFEDIFIALEYPLYAHLMPAQRFYDNMPASTLMAQIFVGKRQRTHKRRRWSTLSET